MARPSSEKRCEDATERFRTRLGLPPQEIFTPPQHLLLSLSDASSFIPRPELHPPKWSVGLLEALSGLADQVQAQQPPTHSHPTAHQQAEDEDSPMGIRVSQALIDQVDTRIKLHTRTRGRGAATVTIMPKMCHLTPEDVKVVSRDWEANVEGGSTSSAYEDTEYENQEEKVEEQIEVEGEEEESADDGLEDQYTEGEGGDGISHKDYESSEDCRNADQSADLSLPRDSGHRSVDEMPSLTPAPSPAESAAQAATQTSSRDEHIALANLTCLAPLPASLIPTSTTTAATKSVANSIAGGHSSTINDFNLYRSQQAQSSFSHILPAVSTHTPLPECPDPLTALRSHESPEHSPSATCSQPLFPNKRARLDICRSGQPTFTNQLDSNETQTGLDNNENSITNVHVVDTPAESDSSPKPVHVEDPELAKDNAELSAVRAIVQQYTCLDKSVSELQATISYQRALNADYAKTIAREREISSRASATMKFHQRRLAAAKDKIERGAVVQESLEHALDCLIKEDATDPSVIDMKKVVTAHKGTMNKIQLEIPKISCQLALMEDKFRRSREDHTTAVDRLDQGTKIAASTVARHNATVAKKRKWDHVATYLHVKADVSSRIMDGHSVAAQDLPEAPMDLAHDQQEVVPQ